MKKRLIFFGLMLMVCILSLSFAALAEDMNTTAQTITDAEPCVVTVSGEEPTILLFTPSEDAYYVFKSSARTELHVYFNLFDADDNFEDGGYRTLGKDGDVHFVRKLTAGTTYRLEIEKEEEDISPKTFAVCIEKAKVDENLYLDSTGTYEAVLGNLMTQTHLYFTPSNDGQYSLQVISGLNIWAYIEGLYDENDWNIAYYYMQDHSTGEGFRVITNLEAGKTYCFVLQSSIQLPVDLVITQLVGTVMDISEPGNYEIISSAYNNAKLYFTPKTKTAYSFHIAPKEPDSISLPAPSIGVSFTDHNGLDVAAYNHVTGEKYDNMYYASDLYDFTATLEAGETYCLSFEGGDILYQFYEVDIVRLLPTTDYAASGEGTHRIVADNDGGGHIYFTPKETATYFISAMNAGNGVLNPTFAFLGNDEKLRSSWTGQEGFDLIAGETYHFVVTNPYIMYVDVNIMSASSVLYVDFEPNETKQISFFSGGITKIYLKPSVAGTYLIESDSFTASANTSLYFVTLLKYDGRTTGAIANNNPMICIPDVRSTYSENKIDILVGGLSASDYSCLVLYTNSDKKEPVSLKLTFEQKSSLYLYERYGERDDVYRAVIGSVLSDGSWWIVAAVAVVAVGGVVAIIIVKKKKKS